MPGILPVCAVGWSESVWSEFLSLESNGVQGVQTRLKRKDRFESK